MIGIFIVLIVVAATLISIAKHLRDTNKILIEIVNHLDKGVEDERTYNR